MKPLVYLAAPYTHPNPAHNTRDAIFEAEGVRRATHDHILMYVPHLSMLWDLVEPHLYEYWLRYDLGIIEHCQALYRWGGDSDGADTEVKFAVDIGIPVLYSRDDLVLWALANA